MTDTPTHPPCVACDGPVLRRTGEKPNEWLVRQTCSLTCRNHLLAKHATEAALKRGEPESKPCRACGKLMTRGRAESRARFAGRTACSRRCQGRVTTLRAFGTLPPAEARPEPPSEHLRPCVCCGQPIPWPRGLTAGGYRGKSTCGGPECRHGQQGWRPATARLAAEIVSPPSSLYRPSERQRREWRLATPAERRLFAPEIRAALGGANA